MKYAMFEGKRTDIKDVKRGVIGKDCWFKKYDVQACRGRYAEYWRYRDKKPRLPEEYENETEWHAIWKSTVKEDYCEVICGENREHRADICTPEFVIEIQKSPIKYNAVKDRIAFYSTLTGKRVIWVVNVYSALKNIETIMISKKLFRIRWKYKKKWVDDMLTEEYDKTIFYLDISPTAKNLIHIWKHKGVLYGNWMGKQKFFDMYLSKYSTPTEDFAACFTKLKGCKI